MSVQTGYARWMVVSIRVALTEREWRLFAAAARARGENVGTWMRNRALAAIGRRPRKGPGRSTRIGRRGSESRLTRRVGLLAEERAAFIAAAELAGCPVSTWIRNACRASLGLPPRMPKAGPMRTHTRETDAPTGRRPSSSSRRIAAREGIPTNARRKRPQRYVYRQRYIDCPKCGRVRTSSPVRMHGPHGWRAITADEFVGLASKTLKKAAAAMHRPSFMYRQLQHIARKST